jgi:hypothetical protein
MPSGVEHTNVIGILGAFGKTNETSSNLLRRRQFSARKILPQLVLSQPICVENTLPACPAVSKPMGNDDRSCVAFESWDNQWCLASHRFKVRERVYGGVYEKMFGDVC